MPKTSTLTTGLVLVTLTVLLTGCRTGTGGPESSQSPGGQAAFSSAPTPRPKNVAEVSASFTVTTRNGFTADATMSYSITPFTKSIVDAAPGHTNLSAVISSSATATNTTKGRQNPEMFTTSGWIAYDKSSNDQDTTM